MSSPESETQIWIERARMYALDPDGQGFGWVSMCKHERKAWRAVIGALEELDRRVAALEAPVDGGVKHD